MAKTIRTKVYSFNELNDEAKQVAIQWYREKILDTYFIYDEAHKSVKAFHELFGIKEGSRSFLS